MGHLCPGSTRTRENVEKLRTDEKGKGETCLKVLDH